MLFAERYRFQALAGFIANIICIINGSIFGWSSAAFLELQAADSPLKTGPMTANEIGWVGSSLCLGGLVGVILFAWLSDQFGRTRSLLLLSVPALLCWTIIIYAQNPLHFCIARFFGGLVGGTIAVIPIYITEISDDRLRGTLVSLMIPSMNVGMLFVFILGNYFSYKTTAQILAPWPVIFFIAFFHFPETPQFLLKKNKVRAAEASLHFYRNINDRIDEFHLEMKKLKTLQSEEKAAITLEDFCNKPAKKALTIGIALMFLTQLSGSFALIVYTAPIFQQSGSNLTPKVSAIIVAFIMVVGSYTSTFLVDIAGRKILLAMSSIGASIGLFTLAAYDYLSGKGFDMQDFNWVPITSLGFTIFILNIGIHPLPCLIIAEVMPQKIRNIGNMLCVSILWLLAFHIVLFFPILSAHMGMYGTLFIFGNCTFLGAIFTIVFIPETKGKTLDKIHLML